jgi:uncharacterized membrane protein
VATNPFVIPGKKAALVAVVASALGLIFGAYSTYDYAEQLDRQVHAVHCSFIPGAPVSTDADNPCKTALFSPYSAVMRATWWGGVPISLFALGAFAFFVGFGLYLAMGGAQRSKWASPFYALASAGPMGASLVMLYISATHLHVFCKLCVGIYVASLMLALAALRVWRVDSHSRDVAMAPTMAADPRRPPPTDGFGKVILWAAALGAASILPAFVYVALLPDYRPMLDKCGKLAVANEAHGGLLKIATPHPIRPVLLFEDPLCPTCKAFHERIVDEGIFDRLDVTLALFPLDSDCNWMLDRSLHPGACVVSKAILCGGNDKTRSILEWAFENQEELTALGKQNPTGLTSKIAQRWGADISACVARPSTGVRLNQHLHFAANNHIPVSTPQMFLGDKRICDEDTDLGLKYTLAQLAPEVLQ